MPPWAQYCGWERHQSSFQWPNRKLWLLDSQPIFIGTQGGMQGSVYLPIFVVNLLSLVRLFETPWTTDFPVLHHLLKLAQTQWGSGISVCRWSVCDLQNEDSNPDLLSNFSIFSTFSRNLLSRKISSSPVKWGLGRVIRFGAVNHS